jgi:hypothetical protein
VCLNQQNDLLTLSGGPFSATLWILSWWFLFFGGLSITTIYHLVVLVEPIWFPKGSLLYVWNISVLCLQLSISNDILFDIVTTIQLIYNVKFIYVLPIYCDHFAPLLAPSAASLIFLAACVSRQYRVIFVHGRALAHKAIDYISAPTMILYNMYNI